MTMTTEATTEAASETITSPLATSPLATSPLILTVDCNVQNLKLLSRFLSQENYQTMAVKSLPELEQVLIKLNKIDLALIDISGFNRDIWTYCEQLQRRKIPVLVVLPARSSITHCEKFGHGVERLLVKPLVVRELLGVIQHLIGEHA